MTQNFPPTSPFTTAEPAEDLRFDLSHDQHPTRVAVWEDSWLELDDSGTHFGFVQSGRVTLTTANGTFEMHAGMYFAIPGPAELESAGCGFVVTRLGYRGFFQIGGPIEETGRLKYIDGCTDSLLISPVLKGDPCLNFLHIPAGTDQTAHTHPSLRIGMITGGKGFCRTDEGDVPLYPGLFFIIPTGGLHSFHTQDRELQIIAWHPDSDFGPTHEKHPMLNRTIVNGAAVNSSGVP